MVGSALGLARGYVVPAPSCGATVGAARLAASSPGLRRRPVSGYRVHREQDGSGEVADEPRRSGPSRLA